MTPKHNKPQLLANTLREGDYIHIRATYKFETNMAKYYTPTIEEFYHGFEYERFIQEVDGNNATQPSNSNNWIKAIFDGTEFDGENGLMWWSGDERCNVSFEEGLEYTRVKLLDEEDIVGVGWARIAANEFVIKQADALYVLNYDNQSKVEIIVGASARGIASKDYLALFQGTIRNKSELKQVMRMVGVKAV